MKKLMTLAALVAACAPAFTAEVTSSNIVGYQKIAIPQNSMDIVAAQFQPIGGGSLSIQDLVASDDFADDGTDWIRIYDASTGTYTLAAWWATGVWAEDADDEDDPIAAQGWGTTDGLQTVIDIDVAPGEGFWAKSVGGGTITASGEVVSSGVVQVPANKMALVANPYPVATDIQDIVASEDFADDGTDWIRVYDESTGTYTLAAWWATGVWAEDAGDEDDPIAAQGWGTTDGLQTVINITLAPGQGFWVKSVGGGTLTFPAPAAHQ